MAQQVEHFLGKEEVTGSNPVSSSTKERLNRRSFFVRCNRFSHVVICNAESLQQ